MKPLVANSNKVRPTPITSSLCLRKLLLVCGILSSGLYVAMNVVIPVQFNGYDSVSQTVSELSAIDAPSRPLWLLLAFPYTLLVTAFGCGVRLSAQGNHRLRMTGNFLVIYGALGFGWPFAPMHLRGAAFSSTDTWHIAFAMATVLLMVLALGFGAFSLGKEFRIYSIATLLILALFGTLTGVQSPRIAANLPTPWIGVWERINIGVFLTWIVVLAVALLRNPSEVCPNDVRDLEDGKASTCTSDRDRQS